MLRKVIAYSAPFTKTQTVPFSQQQGTALVLFSPPSSSRGTREAQQCSPQAGAAAKGQVRDGWLVG